MYISIVYIAQCLSIFGRKERKKGGGMKREREEEPENKQKKCRV